MELCLSYFVSFITSYCPGPILESKGLRAAFQRKGQKRAKYLKIWAKMSKFENILKKGSLVRATIACMKQLEYAQIGNSLTIYCTQSPAFFKISSNFVYFCLNFQIFCPF